MERKLVIATMHGKEQVLAPLFQQLGFGVSVAQQINTDALGTFTGEIERTFTPIEAAIAKCHLAIQQTGIPCAVASEGSFGPHPHYYWLASDEEFVVFVDCENDLQIVGKVISTGTNFSAANCKKWEDVQLFAKQVQFPSHAVIAKKSKNDFSEIEKGIQSSEALFEVANLWLNQHGQIYLETDMRAMFNPSRMKVIKQAGEALVNKFKQQCPQCRAPGFDVVKNIQGLICAVCGMPTQNTLAYRYGCKKCGFFQEKMYPKGQKVADPQFCESCNP